MTRPSRRTATPPPPENRLPKRPPGRGRLSRGLDLASRTALVMSLVGVAGHLWFMRHVPMMGTDSLIYHLTIPVQWLHQGLLARLDLPFHDSAAENSPMLYHLLVYLVMRITGDAELVWVIQPVFYLTLFGLLYRSARLLGAPRRLAAVAAALFFFHAPFLSNIAVANNDLVATCGYAVFVYGLLLAQIRFERGVLVAALGLAMLTATKTVGVVYVAAGLAALSAVIVWRLGRPGPKPRGMRLWLPVVGLLLLGSVFHLRNLVLYQNPLYPARISILGFTIFDGLYESSALIDHGWSPRALAQMLVNDDRLYALTTPGSYVLWAGFLVSAAVLIARRRTKVAVPRMAACLVLPALAIVLYFSVVPFWREHRLLFTIHYSLWVSFALAMTSAARRAPRTRRLVEIGALGAYACLAVITGPPALWSIAISVAVAAATMFPRLPARRGRWLAVSALAAAVGAAALCGLRWYPAYRSARFAERCERYPRYWGTVGEAWNLVEDLTGAGEGKTIAYAGTPVVFPLFGSRLKNRICYVPLSDEDHPRSVEVAPGESVPRKLALARRGRADDAYWLRGIREQHVDLLFLHDRADLGGVAAELGMVRRHPERFVLPPLFQGDGVYLIAVRRGGTADELDRRPGVR